MVFEDLSVSEFFEVTPRACAALKDLANDMGIVEPIFAIALARTEAGDRFGVGVYTKQSIGDDAEVFSISELQFYLDPSMRDEMRGVVIDYKQGRFKRLTQDGR